MPHLGLVAVGWANLGTQAAAASVAAPLVSSGCAGASSWGRDDRRRSSPFSDEQLRHRYGAAIGAVPDDARDSLRWLRRGHLVTSPLLPLGLRRALLRLGGVKLGAMVWGLKHCWARGAADQHRHRLVDRRGLLVGGQRTDRDRLQLPPWSGGADPDIDPPARP